MENCDAGGWSIQWLRRVWRCLGIRALLSTNGIAVESKLHHKLHLIFIFSFSFVNNGFFGTASLLARILVRNWSGYGNNTPHATRPHAYNSNYHRSGDDRTLKIFGIRKSEETVLRLNLEVWSQPNFFLSRIEGKEYYRLLRTSSHR